MFVGFIRTGGRRKDSDIKKVIEGMVTAVLNTVKGRCQRFSRNGMLSLSQRVDVVFIVFSLKI